jgi:hypothetical protein
MTRSANGLDDWLNEVSAKGVPSEAPGAVKKIAGTAAKIEESCT